MKTIIPILLACLLFNIAGAQMNPLNYHLYIGNPDGSSITVGLGQVIQIPIYASTDPNNQEDSIGMMHIPVATNDLIITARNGGFFPAGPGVGEWDDIAFVVPNGSNQSILGFHYLTEPYDPQNLLFTNGEIQLIAHYIMQTTTDPGYLNQVVSPFTIGYNPNLGGLLWASQGWEPAHTVVPTVHLGSLYFTSMPNCSFEPGDANGNDLFNGLDVTYSVNFLKGIGNPPPVLCDCHPYGIINAAADANGNCVYNGLDITYSVNYLKGFGEAPLACSNCPGQE